MSKDYSAVDARLGSASKGQLDKVQPDLVTTFGPGMLVTGNVVCAGAVQVFGRVIGDIHAAHLIIGEGAYVEGNVTALDAIVQAVPLDMLQLHGHESPARVAEIRARFGLPVMKAVGIAEEADLAAIAGYAQVADQILIDAKPPKGAALPGGNGLAFDWRLIAGRAWERPWMLAGGLTPANVAEAVRLTGARQVDVSSGVESAPGVKDPVAIAAFIAAAG